ncbi:MAG: hypothetical protein JXJ04_09090 [Spirochaetales bacterium]|nr:hypothetical protein [Spirochaetales bacterium]
MAITQSTGPGKPGNKRLVILWILFLCINPCHLYPETIISQEDAGRLPIIYKDGIETEKIPDLYKNPLIYLCFIPGIIILIILLVVKKRRIHGLLLIFFSFCLITGAATEKKNFIEQGIKFFNSKNYRDALNKFKQAEDIHGPLAGLCYNNALCYYHLDKKGYAIFELYRAIKKAPMDRRFTHSLYLIEKEEDLTSQINSAPFIHPNIPFICMIILFNLTSIALGLVFRYKKGIIVIIFVLLSIGTIGVTTSFILTQLQIQEKICVVTSREGMLKQIPLPSSRTWVLLKEGTSIKVLGNAKGYYLVQTGRGLKGWIREADVKVE